MLYAPEKCHLPGSYFRDKSLVFHFVGSPKGLVQRVSRSLQECEDPLTLRELRDFDLIKDLFNG